jgi:hypothetical protein
MITMIYWLQRYGGGLHHSKKTNEQTIYKIIKGRSGIINELVLSVKSGTFIVVESVD